MAERKSLVHGLNKLDPALEKAFVRGQKPGTKQADPPPPVTEVKKEKPEQSITTVSRVPLTTRIRSDFASALKRASLERQLKKVIPNTVQDILEQALEPWLRDNGYLD